MYNCTCTTLYHGTYCCTVHTHSSIIVFMLLLYKGGPVYMYVHVQLNALRITYGSTCTCTVLY